MENEDDWTTWFGREISTRSYMDSLALGDVIEAENEKWDFDAYYSNDDVKSSVEILHATAKWREGYFEDAIDIFLNGNWYTRKEAIINILIAEACEAGLYTALEYVVRKHVEFIGRKPIYYKLLDDHLKVVTELGHDRQA